MYVAYYRVSTSKQGDSGLGLEAQREAVQRFTSDIAESFEEIESGKNNDRPQLRKAIAACRRLGATLVIAKLDRLARNVHFITGLQESGIEFIACDMPTANTFTIHILAAVAQHEAKMISERTKVALAAKKARGEKLGTPRNIVGMSARGVEASQELAAKHCSNIKPVAERLRSNGLSLAAIADHLTEQGMLTRRRKAWTATGVMRLLAV